MNRLRGRSILDERAEQAPQVFQSPPFTPELVEAVKLVSTRLPLRADEASRQLWQREANAASLNEYEALAPLFERLAKPRKILEVGPGFGRSVVWFSRKFGWEESTFDLYDTTGVATKYKQKFYSEPPRWPDVSSFCGNLLVLEQMLRYNRITNFRIFDAKAVPLKRLPGPYDLIYGFFSIGFHWSVEHYLDDIDALLGPAGAFVCTMNKHFKMFPRLKDHSARVLACREIKKGAAPLRLLVLSKAVLPDVGEPL